MCVGCGATLFSQIFHKNPITTPPIRNVTIPSHVSPAHHSGERGEILACERATQLHDAHGVRHHKRGAVVAILLVEQRRVGAALT